MIEYGGPHEWAAPAVATGRDDRVVVATHMVARAVHVGHTPGINGPRGRVGSYKYRADRAV